MLIWNVVGWLSFGIILNHTHTQGEGPYCEITFCSCKVEEGQRICFCHHHNLHKPGSKDHHSDNAHGEHTSNWDEDLHATCYYTIPHADNNSTTQALIVLVKFNALYQYSSEIPFYEKGIFVHPHFSEDINPGKAARLYRPPRA